MEDPHDEGHQGVVGPETGLVSWILRQRVDQKNPEEGKGSHAIERLEGGRLAREQITHAIAELLDKTLLEEGYAQTLFKFIH